MADKTFGFKVSEEVYEKAKLMIDASGVSSKEWFEKAMALYELNSIKLGSSDYTQDLTELEHHTTRMYELIVNMIQRSVYLQEHAVKKVEEKLESKEAIITDLQEQNKAFKEELTKMQDLIASLQEQLEERNDKLLANQTMLENNQALIDEYKQKNHTLNELVTEYKVAGDENVKLKKQLNEIKATLTARAVKAEEQTNVLTKQVNEKNAELAKIKQQHEETLQLALEKKDLEREKAIIEIERRYQEKIAQLNATHNEEIRALYDEIAALRKTNDENREKWQKEIEALKKKKES